MSLALSNTPKINISPTGQDVFMPLSFEECCSAHFLSSHVMLHATESQMPENQRVTTQLVAQPTVEIAGFTQFEVRGRAKSIIKSARHVRSTRRKF